MRRYDDRSELQNVCFSESYICANCQLEFPVKDIPPIPAATQISHLVVICDDCYAMIEEFEKAKIAFN